ncbi:proteoglycan 4 isoform X2 [Papilio machaon]|uniref:proteoglycan 4 isoform X2 n=1 Tax=Papilio machaon TaxID=76193 RepID=UPI001E664E8B|nr:proteoglycan 4 isoform X2 [Papilio machaon]
MRSTYNESKHAIFVSDVDTCCSIDELRRNYSRSCNKKNSCHGPCKAKSKKKRKKGVDRAQIFPEKLSCGVESRHEETTTKRFPSDSRTREQVYQPRGCVPYKPPPGMTKETCERGSCFPSPCDSEKKCSTDTKPEKLPRRKDSDRRVTVNSKVKTIEPPSPCPPEPATKKCEETTQKTRVIEVKPKESIKSISQECGCTEAPPAAQRSVSREKHKKKVDKSSSAHRVKKPHTDDCKPKTKPIPTLKPAPSCDKPSKQNIKNSLLSDTKKISTDRKRRRDEVRAKINTSLSDTQTSRAGLRHSSNDSRMRPPSRQTSKTRNKSAPCNYRKPENENMKSNTKTVPSKETTPSKGLSDVKIPNKPKSDQCEPKVCTDARKISAPTRDVAVDIRCPICTCATQCHGTRCYRSTEIINPNLNVEKEEVESPDNSLDDDALFSDYTSEEITDTTLQSRTVCSRVAVEYCDRVTKIKHPCKTCCKSIEKIRRIRKVNKGTCTKSRRLKDVGTTTKCCKSERIQRRGTCKRDRGICTEGKLVTFKSCTQIIPPCK